MSKDKQRILREETEIDYRTGEVARRKHTVQFEPEPNYIKLYLDCLGVFSGNAGLSVSLNEIFIEILKLVSYADDDQLVTVNAFVKQRIAKKTGRSVRRIEQALQLWIDNKVLFRVARGTYQLNPYLFGRGDWRDVKNLRSSLDFGNRVMETEKVFTEVETDIKEQEQVEITY